LAASGNPGLLIDEQEVLVRQEGAGGAYAACMERRAWETTVISSLRNTVEFGLSVICNPASSENFEVLGAREA
jgi:hypothetical protein